jgi:RNA polymerase sigma factor (sigma-70 family)
MVTETFAKAFKALGGFNGEYAFSTWLYTIARNVFIDHYRHKNSQPEFVSNIFTMTGGHNGEETETEYEIPDDRTACADYCLLRAERHQEIRQAILSLPPKYLTVIILRYDEEREYQEIADILQIPIGTVKARLFRAKRLLSERLSQHLKAA